MAKVSTNISLDEGLKKASQALFADLGIDITTAVTIFLKQCIRVQGLPFEVIRDVPVSEDVPGKQARKSYDTSAVKASDQLPQNTIESSDSVSDIVDLLMAKYDYNSRPGNDSSIGVQDRIEVDTQHSFVSSHNSVTSDLDTFGWHKVN